MQLNGKTVYITGGTGGIGAPLVRMLRESGAVVMVYDIEKQGDLVQNIDKICAYLEGNTPDILINMAGYNDFNYCEDQNMKAIIDLNMMVPIRLSQAVLRGMKSRGSGHIVNIGSMTALIPLPHLTGYVAAKAGLKGFSDSLRRELGGMNIAVTYVIPRAVKTGMNSGIRADINDRTKVTYDDPDIIAHKILKAIEDRKKEARFGFPERIFAVINALCPSIIDRGLIKNRLIGEELLNSIKTPKEIFHEQVPVPSIRSAG